VVGTGKAISLRSPRWGLRTLALGMMLSVLPTAQSAERILALGGDITEMVCALERCAQLVGVDATSLWPSEVQSLPNVGYVRQLSAEGVLSLRPDLVLATHDAGPPHTLSQLKAAGAHVESFEAVRDAAGILRKLERVSELLDREAEAGAITAELLAQAAELDAAVKSMTRKPRVLFVMSASSGGLLGAGRDTAADAAIHLAGGINAVDGYSGYKPLAAESLIELAPEIILIMAEHEEAANTDLARQPGVNRTPAARNNRILRVEGQALLGFSLRTIPEALALQRQFASAAVP
jgi:iron complex transport system substrate-binding protein